MTDTGQDRRAAADPQPRHSHKTGRKWHELTQRREPQSPTSEATIGWERNDTKPTTPQGSSPGPGFQNQRDPDGHGGSVVFLARSWLSLRKSLTHEVRKTPHGSPQGWRVTAHPGAEEGQAPRKSSRSQGSLLHTLGVLPAATADVASWKTLKRCDD